MASLTQLGSLSGVDQSALTFDATVPRRLLHKAAVEAVLLTDSVAIGDGEFLCAGFLPRGNTPGSRALSARFARYDFTTIFELSRQVALLVTHKHLGVPSDYATLLSDMSCELCDVSAAGAMTKPVATVIRVAVALNHNKRGRLVGGDFSLQMFAEDRLIARAAASGTVVPTEKYKIARLAGRNALLPRSRPAPTNIERADPGVIGMRPGSSTLIGGLVAHESDPRQFRTQLIIDPSDVFFYDHPINHVPGIVLCEALRQAAVVAACRRHPGLSPLETLVRQFTGRFSSFGEPDIGIDIDLTVDEARITDGRAAVNIEGVVSQVGNEPLVGRIELELGIAEGPR